jgi:hypothetical protein
MRNTIHLMLSGAIVSLVSFSPANAQAPQSCKAEYVGSLVLSPDSNGRSMTLQAPFAFKDKGCTNWNVPKGAAVDGASIPRIFWSLIGGPWEGNYRNASVIHDWFCAVRTRPWKAVHRMFFDGMIASGVSPKTAKVMYLAVYYGGPRWDDLAIRNSRLISAEMKRVNPEVFKQMSSAYASLSIGKVKAAEASLATAKTEMRTNGDQFAVASLAREIAQSKNDETSATTALDAMIFSGVPDVKTLGVLQVERAQLAYAQGDFQTAAQSARNSLSVDFNENAVQLLATLKRDVPASVDDKSTAAFEPTEIEFQRLANIVEKDDLTPEQIETLVDGVRGPSRE